MLLYTVVIAKKLRYFDKTQKVSIGAVHKLIESGTVTYEHAKTFKHRVDGFTKTLVPATFLVALYLISVQTPAEV